MRRDEGEAEGKRGERGAQREGVRRERVVGGGGKE